MKKTLILIILNLFTTASYADHCKVSGISDSPQSITCRYKDGWSERIKLHIQCVSGIYQYSEIINKTIIGNGLISGSFHEEVEKGASPLNFKLDDSRTLKITKVFGRFFRGEFSSENDSKTNSFRFSCMVR